MDKKLLNVENWVSEAVAIAKDVENHVKKIEVLDGTDQMVYFNLTTIEGNDYCIELSANGFRIVGNGHNQKSLSSEEYFETQYSLLHTISPAYNESFSKELMDKIKTLNDLVNNR